MHSWRIHDPALKAKWDEAIEQGSDRLEDVAIERAIADSDRLLMFLLSGRRPEKYRRAPEANINSAAVVLTPEQMAERLRMLGVSPPILEDTVGTDADGEPGPT